MIDIADLILASGAGVLNLNGFKIHRLDLQGFEIYQMDLPGSGLLNAHVIWSKQEVAEILELFQR